MIEIEFSALSKQCLKLRIASKEELTIEVLSLVKEREEKAVKIDWQFSIESARGKLNRHYRQVNADNAQYQNTWFPSVLRGSVLLPLQFPRPVC